MGSPSQIMVSPGLRQPESTNVRGRVVLNDDQHFLLYFVMGAYFGPDLKGESPKSVFQRIAEGLPPYTSDQVARSHMKRVEVERVYYYLLRKADQSLLVKSRLLDEFFEGNLPNSCSDLTASYPLFPDLFPPQLHQHSRFKNRYKIIENIVFINNSEISYLKPEDVERFKRLTGIEDLVLDSKAAKLQTPGAGSKLHNVPVKEPEPNGESPHASQRNKRQIDGTERLNEQIVYDATPLNRSPSADASMFHDARFLEGFGPTLIFLPSRPTKQEWAEITAATKTGFALTGSAAMGKVGPVIGLMDVGECEDSYLFRVALPGVKRDENEFSCEVDPTGKVMIRGVTTTGEKSVFKYSQVFVMQTQNLCPPGDFSISFQLPGPVDPQQFSGHFGTDGILEGIVMKRTHTS